jgi:hypothetical protein
MDKLEMRIMSAETEVEQKKQYLQASIKKLIELVQEEDISETAFYNAYVSQAEDVRRYANETATAKRVCEVLKAVQA